MADRCEVDAVAVGELGVGAAMLPHPSLTGPTPGDARSGTARAASRRYREDPTVKTPPSPPGGKPEDRREGQPPGRLILARRPGPRSREDPLRASPLSCRRAIAARPGGQGAQHPNKTLTPCGARSTAGRGADPHLRHRDATPTCRVSESAQYRAMRCACSGSFS